MRLLKTEEFFYVGGGDEGGCSTSDTSESCSARQEGYAACSALSDGITAAARASGNETMITLAGEVDGACRTAVDNYVNWAYKTPMYEKDPIMRLMMSLGYTYPD